MQSDEVDAAFGRVQELADQMRSFDALDLGAIDRLRRTILTLRRRVADLEWDGHTYMRKLSIVPPAAVAEEWAALVASLKQRGLQIG